MGYIDPPPFGSNALEGPQLFEQRLIYKEKSFSRLFDPIPLDTIYEKPFYGKVDIYGTPIYPSEVNLTHLPGEGLILAQNFVTAAFNNLKFFIDKALKSQEQIFSDLFASFVPKSAFVSVHQAYNDHFVNNIFEVFVNNYIRVPKINKKIKNFKDLVNEFLHYTRLASGEFPVTKTAFIVSPFCSHAISGLFIELETLDPGDDLLKYERFLSKPSFNRYAKTVNGFGFYVDKNMPWRIAANLDHSVTREYMSKFGLDITDNSVFTGYYKSEYYSYESMKARLWNMYATLMADPRSKTYGSIYKVQNCTTMTYGDVASNRFTTNVSEGFREDISLDYENEFQEQYNDEYFLPIYFQMRLIENKAKYSAGDFKAAMSKILNFYKWHGIKAAVTYMGFLTKQTKIYEEPQIDQTPPYKIKYFGEGVSSGLYSYILSDTMVQGKIKKETELTSCIELLNSKII
jgi:hypothetical protein